MTSNLLRQEWDDLDSYELRLVLEERIGGPGQYDGHASAPNRIHLPLAREACRVVLEYRSQRIVRIAPGAAFDPTEWERLVSEVNNDVLSGPTKVGREYSFSSYRVDGWWRGERSGVQILPPHPEAPIAPVEMAEHPFILEFPMRWSELSRITNHRRVRDHRRLTLLLNTLLAGRTNAQLRQSPHAWGCYRDHDDALQTRWVQNSYLGRLGPAVVDECSAPEGEPLEIVEAQMYFDVVRGIDGRGLRIPSDLDEWICRYRILSAPRRELFDRAAYWLDISSRQWSISVSASFAALVSTIEALIDQRGPGSTARFHDFLEHHAPGASLAQQRTDMYDLRSGILHGRAVTLELPTPHFGKAQLAAGVSCPHHDLRHPNAALGSAEGTRIRRRSRPAWATARSPSPSTATATSSPSCAKPSPPPSTPASERCGTREPEGCQAQPPSDVTPSPDLRPVPRLSEFYGIVIYMYWNDHEPAHFHAIYSGYEALVRIDDGTIVAGSLPRTAVRLVSEWRLLRLEELAADWERARAFEPLNPIEGLQ